MKVRRDSPTLVAEQPLTLRECQDAISSWQRIVATEHALLQEDIRQKSHCGVMKVRRDSPTLVAAQPLTLRECQDATSS